MATSGRFAEVNAHSNPTVWTLSTFAYIKPMLSNLQPIVCSMEHDALILGFQLPFAHWCSSSLKLMTPNCFPFASMQPPSTRGALSLQIFLTCCSKDMTEFFFWLMQMEIMTKVKSAS